MSDHAMASYSDFLFGMFRNPKSVSALTPSSPSLARAIAEELDVSRQGRVIELGPGTGAITQALLARGIAPEMFLLVECEPLFVLILRKLYPLLDVRYGDALHFEQYLTPSTVVSAVISGLPLLHFPKKIRRHLIDRGLAYQDRDGLFVQLSYGWHPPVPADAELLVTRKTVWTNFPPANIWVYRKKLSERQQ